MKLLTPITPRPTNRTPAVIKAAAERLMPAVLKWSVNNGGLNDEEEKTEIIKQLVKLLEWHPGDDGYRLAKELDSDGWDADSELVEILDDASTVCHSELCKLEEEWVKEQAVTPPPIDIKVTDTNNPYRGVGVLCKHAAGGKSVVCYEHLGNVKKGPGTYGYILKWEDLETVD